MSASSLALTDTRSLGGPTVPLLEIVVPVHNEEVDLEPCIDRLRSHLGDLPFSALITIADNASTDGTALVAHRLAGEHGAAAVRVLHLPEKGRGRALKQAWSSSASPVLVYMDVDLSTDLNALLPLVAPLLSGHSDLAIGSRLSRGSRTLRGPRREIISRGYNLLLHGTLRTGVRDAQCGFKAIRRDVARELLPLVEDDGWFFDTELLVLAERAGLRIHEVPVDWTDDPDSRVDIVRTAWADLRGIARLARALATGRLPLHEVGDRVGRTPPRSPDGVLGDQIARFLAVGLLSTAAYAVLYLALRYPLPAFTANAAALLVTAVANTAANRRLTFGVRGARDRWRHQAQGLLILGAGLALTSAALVLLHIVAPAAGRGVEVAVLTVTNLVVTALRFVLMRGWVFVVR
ncbi:MAG: glycosyltransferase [Nocardioides sp.]